jgi:hypothetical protein
MYLHLQLLPLAFFVNLSHAIIPIRVICTSTGVSSTCGVTASDCQEGCTCESILDKGVEMLCGLSTCDTADSLNARFAEGCECVEL